MLQHDSYTPLGLCSFSYLYVCVLIYKQVAAIIVATGRIATAAESYRSHPPAGANVQAPSNTWFQRGSVGPRDFSFTPETGSLTRLQVVVVVGKSALLTDTEWN